MIYQSTTPIHGPTPMAWAAAPSKSPKRCLNRRKPSAPPAQAAATTGQTPHANCDDAAQYHGNASPENRCCAQYRSAIASHVCCCKLAAANSMPSGIPATMRQMRATHCTALSLNTMPGWTARAPPTVDTRCWLADQGHLRPDNRAIYRYAPFPLHVSRSRDVSNSLTPGACCSSRESQLAMSSRCSQLSSTNSNSCPASYLGNHTLARISLAVNRKA